MGILVGRSVFGRSVGWQEGQRGKGTAEAAPLLRDCSAEGSSSLSASLRLMFL